MQYRMCGEFSSSRLSLGRVRSFGETRIERRVITCNNSRVVGPVAKKFAEQVPSMARGTLEGGCSQPAGHWPLRLLENHPGLKIGSTRAELE
jgi:hypothetical protein